MDKYVLFINDEDKDLKYRENGKEVSLTNSFYPCSQITFSPLNSINVSLIKNALSTHKVAYKDFMLLHKIMQSISVQDKARDMYVYVKKLDTAINFFQKINSDFVCTLSVKGGNNYLRGHYTQVREGATVILEDVRHDHQTMFMSNAKNKLSILKNIALLQRTDVLAIIGGLKNLISKLNTSLPDAIMHEHNFGNFHLNITIEKSKFLILYKDFFDSLQKYLLKMKEDTKDFPSEDILIKKFEGFLTKVEDKKKSYMYLVKNRQGEVGFLGIKIKKVHNDYSQFYSLRPVKSVSAALVFEDSDYTKCGIKELTNKGLYPVIEVVECAQAFNMQNKSFTDPEMSAFASGLEKLKIENFLENEVPLAKEAPKKVNKL